LSSTSPPNASDAKVVALSSPASTAGQDQPASEGLADRALSGPPPEAGHRDASGGDDEHLNTDDRARLDWKGHYPAEARKEIRLEAWVVALILITTFVSLLLTWRGTSFDLAAGGCTTCVRAAFDQYAYYYLGGQLGGILFGVKYLYKVVARGYWNLDRRLWRFFSPFLSGGLAVVVGALVDSGLVGLTAKASTGAGHFALGFIVGYFADSALAKMQEIADTVFGSPSRRRGPGGSSDKQ
jgi:hypothetical protein